MDYRNCGKRQVCIGTNLKLYFIDVFSGQQQTFNLAKDIGQEQGRMQIDSISINQGGTRLAVGLWHPTSSDAKN